MEVTKIGRTLKELLDEFIEGHEETKKYAIMAIMGHAHLLILGKTGTAKTRLGEVIAMGSGLRFFSKQLHKEIQFHELFGDTVVEKESVEADNKKIEKVRISLEKNHILKAEIALLDEIARGPYETLNILLRVLNERKWEDEVVPLRTLFGTMNESEYFSEVMSLNPQFIDRFHYAIRTRSLVDKGRYGDLIRGIQKTRRGMYRNIEDIRPVVSHKDLDEAYHRIKGIESPVVVPPAMDEIFVLLTEIMRKNLQLDDSNLITDRDVISKWVEMIRAHALYDGRLVATLDDLNFLYGFNTKRIGHRMPQTDKDCLNQANKLLQSFIEEARKEKELLTIYDQIEELELGTEKTLTRRERSNAINQRRKKGKEILMRLKRKFIAEENPPEVKNIENPKGNTRGDANQFDQPPPEESHENEDRNNDTQKEKDPFLSAEGEKQKRDIAKDFLQSGDKQRDQENSSEPSEFKIDPNAAGNEFSIGKENQAGPDSDYSMRGDNNFQLAKGVSLLFNWIEFLRQFYIHLATEEHKQGYPKYYTTLDLKKLHQVMNTEKASLLEWLANSFPVPQIRPKVNARINLIPIRDISLSMADSATWASQFLQAMLVETQLKKYSMNCEIEFHQKVRVLLSGSHELARFLFAQTEVRGATDFGLALRVLNGYVKSEKLYEHLNVAPFITDGIPSTGVINPIELDPLFDECRKNNIVLVPIFIINPIATYIGAYYENGTITYPAVLSRMANMTGGAVFWGIFDPRKQFVMVTSEMGSPQVINQIIRETGSTYQPLPIQPWSGVKHR